MKKLFLLLNSNLLLTKDKHFQKKKTNKKPKNQTASVKEKKKIQIDCK